METLPAKEVCEDLEAITGGCPISFLPRALYNWEARTEPAELAQPDLNQVIGGKTK